MLGFYPNEDSAGGGKVDYTEHEWASTFFNNNLNIALSSPLYESSEPSIFKYIYPI